MSRSAPIGDLGRHLVTGEDTRHLSCIVMTQ